MGQLLSHPVEDKTIEGNSHDTFTYGIGSMQGYRMTMEDAHHVRINQDELLAVFGVFDGHGGKSVAEYISKHLTREIFKKLNSNRQPDMKLSDYMVIIKDCFFKIDQELFEIGNYDNCGSTAIIATIIDKKYIIVANTGDSRCILSLNGGIPKTLSFDHKPILMNERLRVENSNGYIMNNRINEILALSRAFGDFKFKIPVIDSTSNKYIIQNKKFFKQGLINLPPELFQVSVEPDFLIYDFEVQLLPEFLVIACDGIWDCYKNNVLINIIRNKLSLGWKVNKIIEFILHDCLTMANNYTGIGFDNMTLVIVAIHPNSDIDSWYDSIKNKVLREKNLD